MHYPLRLKAYFLLFIITGAVLLALVRPELEGPDLWLLWGTAAAIALFERFRALLPGSPPLILAVLWIFGPGVAMWADALGVLAEGSLRRARPWPLAFNAGQLVAALYLAHLVGRAASSDVFLGFPLTAAAFFFFNALFLQAGMSLYKGTSLLKLLAAHLSADVGRLIGAVLLGLFICWAHEVYGPVALLPFPLLALGHSYAVHRATRYSRSRAVDGVLEAFVSMDEPQRAHAENLVALSSAIGSELGLDEAALRELRYAALLHDIGQRDGLSLERPGRLTAEEVRLVRRHPEQGSELIGRVGVLSRVADIVRHHHEQVDGLGYPDGLRGAEISLEARILHVAEAFDSLVRDRPYRPRQDPARALEIIRRSAGTQFDRRVVEALAAVVEEGRVPSARRRGRVDGPSDTLENLRTYMTRWLRDHDLRWDMGVLDSPGEVGKKAAAILALYELGRIINSSLSLQEVLDRVTKTASDLTHSTCAVALRDGPGELTVRSVQGRAAEGGSFAQRAPGFQLCRQVLASGAPAATAELEGVLPFPHASCGRCLAGPGSVSLAMPLVTPTSVVGVICVHRGRERPFDATEINILQVIAHQASLAVRNAMLYTETKRQLDEIKAMRRLTDTVFRDVGVGIVVVDRQGALEFYSKAAASILRGVVSFPQPGQRVNLRRLFEPLGDPLMLGDVLERPARETGRQVRVGKLWLDVHTSSLVDEEGRVTGAISIFQDITDRKRMEEEMARAERLAVVGRMAAGAAHEIRNPLAAIKGFVQLYQRYARSGRRPRLEHLDLVLREIDRIETIIQDMLLTARPPRPKLRDCDLAALLAEVLRLLDKPLRSKGIRVSKRGFDGNSLVLADPAQLRQVLLNVLGNAVDACSEAGNIEVSLSRRGNRTVIAVKDDGRGIDPEDLPRIFDPFFTTKDEGTGLGLPVSLQIIRNHGGTIEVESEPGQGSVFLIQLPSVEGRDDQGTRGTVERGSIRGSDL